MKHFFRRPKLILYFAMLTMSLGATAVKAAAQINPNRPAGPQAPPLASVAIHVKIHVSTNGKPVSGVHVVIAGSTTKRGVTNSSGIVSAALPIGNYTITATKGTASVKMPYSVAGSTQDITVELAQP